MIAPGDNDLAEFCRLEHPEKYLLVNKIDTDSTNAIQKKLGAALAVKGQDLSRIYWVSAKTGQGLEQIESDLKERVLNDVTETTSAVTQARHVNLLQKIHSCLHKAIALIIRDESPEFIAFELQEAIRATHEILGKEFNEQIIDRIFKEFCLGK